MARGRLPMRKVKKVLEYHFDAGRSHRDIAMHCGVARRTVALLVAPGLSLCHIAKGGFPPMETCARPDEAAQRETAPEREAPWETVLVPRGTSR